LSLQLRGLSVKTTGPPGDNVVHFGVYEVPLEDFLAATAYVLTNTDLEDFDERRGFVARLRDSTEGPGHNPGRTRLILP